MVKELQKKFGIGHKLRFEVDEHGMPRAMINTALAEAIIYLNGAHITHYKPSSDDPVLFLSGRSNFIPGKPIRGGIPIIYPWFGQKRDDPSAPMHGFARTSQWQVHSTSEISEVIEIAFSLDELRFTIRVGRALDIELWVQNRSSGPVIFEEALHTYLAVTDVRMCIIEGLSGRTFIDKTDNMQRKSDAANVLRIVGETDRVYVNSQDDCKLIDVLGRRYIRIDKLNSSTTVVWNPGIEKAGKMADFAADEWSRMLCIETANAIDNAITLQPGESHAMSASISVHPFDPTAILAEVQQLRGQKRRAG